MKQQRRTNLPISRCQCGQCQQLEIEDGYPHTFICSGCNQQRWWCYGADDENFSLCDFCVVAGDK
ncbi:hypothetical protein [Gloeothece verrucosa]|uniref:Uncharacterized protein n=1 Tax=Gloeothece verrucosa (strain PCC 7822) TaxID=497965 RepID=E0UEM9_GLOV7|nr:hypothetical protein [Gloeothece verrucosa]ADN16597.1 hypothetical protein Cyan7822_4692 [Gloeothece verrucosa PCC 7822]